MELIQEISVTFFCEPRHMLSKLLRQSDSVEDWNHLECHPVWTVLMDVSVECSAAIPRVMQSREAGDEGSGLVRKVCKQVLTDIV
jgi:hypothetical protein